MGERGVEQLVIHRAFDGEHEDSDACWCRPFVIEADDYRDANDIATETESLNG
jgi:hypothetical protein